MKRKVGRLFCMGRYCIFYCAFNVYLTVDSRQASCQKVLFLFCMSTRYRQPDCPVLLAIF